MAVTEAQLRAFAPWIPAATAVTEDLAAAREVMAARLDSYVPGTITTGLAYQIELRISAYFAYTRMGQGRIESESIAGATSITYAGPVVDYWAQALWLDPTGVLASLGSAHIYAEIHVGGLSHDVKWSALDDADRVQPAFRRDHDGFSDDPRWRS